MKDVDLGDFNSGMAAISALHVPHVEKNLAIPGGAGFYEGEAAVSMNGAIRFDETWQLGGGISVGTGAVAGKAVVTGQW